MPSESAEQTLRRIVAEAVVLVTNGPLPGRRFVADKVIAHGLSTFRLRIWSTLHFYDRGEPYCCGEPGCHLGLHNPIRHAAAANYVRQAMNLAEIPQLEFVEMNSVYHPGAAFVHQ